MVGHTLTCKNNVTNSTRRSSRSCLRLLGAAWVTAILVSCTTLSEPPGISGRYENPGTGEYLEFKKNGTLLYSIVPDNVPIAQRKDQPFLGQYHRLRSGEIKLALNSVHIGLIHVEMSEDEDKLYVEHRISGRVVVFDRVDK